MEDLSLVMNKLMRWSRPLVPMADTEILHREIISRNRDKYKEITDEEGTIRENVGLKRKKKIKE